MVYRLYLVVLAFIVTFCFWPVAALAIGENPDHRVLIVAGDENFPPYEFVDSIDGSQVYRGFNVDLLKAVALSTGYEIQFRPLPWAEAMRALDRGEVHAVGGMKYNSERDKRYDFSEAYMTNSLAIFVRKDMQAIASIDDLTGYKVAVQKDAVSYYRLKDRPVHLWLTSSQEETLALLVNGEVDAAVGNHLTGKYILQRTNKHENIKIVGGAIDPEGYCVAVQEGDPLLAVFNRGLADIKQNGTYDKIYAKWFGEPVDYPVQYYKRNFSIALGGVVVLVVVAAVFIQINLYLQREVKKRTLEIQKINEELQRKDKMEALGKLVACIAHEIRTPLTSIKTFVELLPAKYDNPLFREKISQFVPQEVERLNTIVNDLLSYANPRKIERETTPLKRLIDNVMVFFADAIARQGIDLQIDINEEVLVQVDRQQMKQVMINIFLNAIQAVESTEHAKLTVSGGIMDGLPYLAIFDNGAGIAEENRKFLFEPFFSTKDRGTGLGLFVSYQLAKQNRVDIRIDSQAGSGTRVTLLFNSEENEDAQITDC
ncbi:putative Periplasmic substrate-binding histidine kinase [uncultured Sporomusa sp.]|uniref:histidine kinase n=1 Tax=uncultured Sporomusa sp. TaxID=307249 RepID=A0A212LTQ3_9FIRM|nr:transporter substrate-binding domain-containing protein [uncultured Sporomusa sp.]SCM80871.1 putative Periplasmic substrate-binding histidine kinase [uncultured Sporomusa sp.]